VKDKYILSHNSLQVSQVNLRALTQFFMFCVDILLWAPYWLFQSLKWPLTTKKKKQVSEMELDMEDQLWSSSEFPIFTRYRWLLIKHFCLGHTWNWYQKSQVYSGRILKLTTHLHLPSKWRMLEVFFAPLYAFMEWRSSKEIVLPFLLEIVNQLALIRTETVLKCSLRPLKKYVEVNTVSVTSPILIL
jgi:hypothetical protein